MPSPPAPSPTPAAPSAHGSAATLQALFVTFLWSTSWVLIKIGLRDVPPLTFAGLRYVLAAAILIAIWAPRAERRAELARADATTIRRLVALGLILYAVTQGAQFASLALLPAATASLVLSFTPLVVTLVAVPLLGERTTGTQWIGIAVAIAGAAAYLRPGSAPLAGLLVATLGLVANAAAAILGRGLNRTGSLSPLTLTTASMTVGSVALLATGLMVEGVPTLGVRAWLIVAWLAVVNTAGAFTLWNHTLRHLSATRSSAINNTMLVQIAVLAWVFLGERLGALEIAGLALVVVGTALIQVPRARRRVQVTASIGNVGRNRRSWSDRA